MGAEIFFSELAGTQLPLAQNNLCTTEAHLGVTHSELLHDQIIFRGNY